MANAFVFCVFFFLMHTCIIYSHNKFYMSTVGTDSQQKELPTLPTAKYQVEESWLFSNTSSNPLQRRTQGPDGASAAKGQARP